MNPYLKSEENCINLNKTVWKSINNTKTNKSNKKKTEKQNTNIVMLMNNI